MRQSYASRHARQATANPNSCPKLNEHKIHQNTGLGAQWIIAAHSHRSGGALVARGSLAESELDLAVGAIITLAGVIWSAIAKRNK